MTDNDTLQWFDGIETVITEPLRFKAKLAIGEDAYTSLRVKNKVIDAWDALGAGATAVTIAKSSVVASTFFAPSGILAAIGIGTAVTPVGWVVAAGVVSVGAWVGVTRFIKDQTNDRVIVIPEFINTPMDFLALALFDFISPLALKMSEVDGCIDPSERQIIYNYFVKEWGYDPEFVEKGMAYTEDKLSDFSIEALARGLAEFKKQNPDCNYASMSRDILKLLNELMESDGIIDKREERVLAVVESIFSEVGQHDVTRNIKGRVNKITDSLGTVVNNGINVFKKD
ncbi:MAG: TerB family tellurite resistance protein [Gammaproteobacteria bacterium]|nr:TerB family tellurite resistance protein [Gammaproteobacteria bacterium]